MLEILGQAQNPAVIQSHLKKLFAGIHKVMYLVWPYFKQMVHRSMFSKMACQFEDTDAELVEIHRFLPGQVKFSPNQASITSMQSLAGELVELTGSVQVTESIEQWLNGLAK